MLGSLEHFRGLGKEAQLEQNHSALKCKLIFTLSDGKMVSPSFEYRISKMVALSADCAQLTAQHRGRWKLIARHVSSSKRTNTIEKKARWEELLSDRKVGLSDLAASS